MRINSEKLKEQFHKRNLTAQSVSRELGYSNSYMKNILHKGEMRNSVALSLESLYMIKPETYELKEEPEAPMEGQMNLNDLPVPVRTEETKVEVKIDYQKLFSTIYKAIKKANVEEVEYRYPYRVYILIGVNDNGSLGWVEAYYDIHEAKERFDSFEDNKKPQFLDVPVQ